MEQQIKILENNIKCLNIRLEAISESRQAWIERCEQLEEELKQLSKLKHPDMPTCDCPRSTFELGGGLIDGKL